jgi:hypothetical protein
MLSRPVAELQLGNRRSQDLLSWKPVVFVRPSKNPLALDIVLRYYSVVSRGVVLR